MGMGSGRPRGEKLLDELFASLGLGEGRMEDQRLLASELRPAQRAMS